MIYVVTTASLSTTTLRPTRAGRPVFVAPLDSTKPIPLEVQAGVVDQFAEDEEFASSSVSSTRPPKRSTKAAWASRGATRHPRADRAGRALG